MTDRWQRVAAWFLALSYGVGAPWAAILEYRQQLLSQRFGLPPELIYLVCAVQSICAVGVLIPRTAFGAAAILTVTTVGAIVTHLRIGSPETTPAAIVYTVLQIWFGLRQRRGA